MKKAGPLIALAFIGFAVALAVYIGSHLNGQTVAMLAGTACGVGVALPMGIAAGLYAAAQRRREHNAGAQPPIVILAQPAQSPQPPSPQYGAAPPYYPRHPHDNLLRDGEFEDENE